MLMMPYYRRQLKPHQSNNIHKYSNEVQDSNAWICYRYARVIPNNDNNNNNNKQKDHVVSTITIKTYMHANLLAP